LDNNPFGFESVLIVGKSLKISFIELYILLNLGAYASTILINLTKFLRIVLSICFNSLSTTFQISCILFLIVIKEYVSIVDKEKFSSFLLLFPSEIIFKVFS
jgi:hypothetical protein